MTMARTYPAGVTSWVDLEVADLESLETATRFYGGLFGWTFDQATPDGAPFRYLIAQLDGQDAAGLGGPASSERPGGTEWTTYVAVDDADATAAAVQRAGGQILLPLPMPARAAAPSCAPTLRACGSGSSRPTAGSARRSPTSLAPGTSATCTPPTRPAPPPSTRPSSAGTSPISASPG